MKNESFILSNFANQQPLMRLLDGLTKILGDPFYKEEAIKTGEYVLKKLRNKNHLLNWGGHCCWDLKKKKAVWNNRYYHELKGNQPYYELMWEAFPSATRKVIHAIIAGHIKHYGSFLYDRHSLMIGIKKINLKYKFLEDLKVPLLTGYLCISSCSTGISLIYSSCILFLLTDKTEYLLIAYRLALRWHQARDPITGLCGGILNRLFYDRAKKALGHVHPDINESKIVAYSHQTTRYHYMPLALMQISERLLEKNPDSEIAKQFISWSIDDLKIYYTQCYDYDNKKFISKMTDGTTLKWEEAKEGYYNKKSLSPADPDGCLLWGYAIAYRLSKNEIYLSILRQIMKDMGFGDICSDDKLNLCSENRDWRLIYTFLEIYKSNSNFLMLRMACRIADNIIKFQAENGLFPREGREYARTGDEIPLALLHLFATLQGIEKNLSSPVFDVQYFHSEYYGELLDFQKKKNDTRTYDNNIFYGKS